jgi:hypothetical protein
MQQKQNFITALKIYDDTLWLYSRLCAKECAHGGLSEDDIVMLKDLVLSLLLQAKHLLTDFYVCECGRGADDADFVIDYAAEKGIIWYPDRWKTMYNGLRRRIEEGSFVRNDGTKNLHSPRYLLPTLNIHLAACCWIEQETGKTYTESPCLFNALCNYLSSDAPLINSYPGVSLQEQARAAEEVYLVHAGEYVECICEFKNRMRLLMEERGLAFFLSPTAEMADKVQGPPWGAKFKNEIERKVFLALQDNREIEFVYYSFEDGHCCTSCVKTTPIKMLYDDGHWIVIGSNQHEYNVRLMLCIDDAVYSKKDAGAFGYALSKVE